MPWNIISSRAGSVRPPPNLTSSTGAAIGGFEPSRRLTSASPLFGRGKHPGTTRYSSLEIPGPAHTSGELGTFDDDGFQLPEIEDEEFELHGPAAGVSTQQADNSQWLANTLEDEANNFFAFLQSEIQRRCPVLEKAESQELGSEAEKEENGKGTVTFGELLPPERNSAVVAAQGLLHVLTLVTRGAVRVRQEEDFGEIEMEVVPGVRLVKRERGKGEDQDGDAEGMDLDELMGGEVEGDGFEEEDEDEGAEEEAEGGTADDDEDMYGSG
jgi:meiotic recombination protein REC8